jgi:hypothetical protein
MKPLMATFGLTALFLSAGAFASDNSGYVPAPAATNFTIIEKNQAWPVKSEMTVEPCTLARCLEA